MVSEIIREVGGLTEFAKGLTVVGILFAGLVFTMIAWRFRWFIDRGAHDRLIQAEQEKYSIMREDRDMWRSAALAALTITRAANETAKTVVSRTNEQPPPGAG